MASNIKNPAVSVHQRLLNKAKESSRPFNEFLQHFAIERFIYRLSKSPHADRFILKGALMLWVWSAPASRPTMDIDLLGKIDNRIEVIVSAMKDACRMDVEMESTIAEKFQAMVKLGVLNSRMKDFYDIWILCRTSDFRGKLLAEAVKKTFENRNTQVTVDPKVFDPSFAHDRSKQVQWQGFIRKAKLGHAPEAFEDAVAVVKMFLEPVAVSLFERRAFPSIWRAPGPWQ